MSTLRPRITEHRTFPRGSNPCKAKASDQLSSALMSSDLHDSISARKGFLPSRDGAQSSLGLRLKGNIGQDLYVILRHGRTESHIRDCRPAKTRHCHRVRVERHLSTFI